MIAIALGFLKRGLSIIRGLWADHLGHRVIVSLAIVVGLIGYTAVWYGLGKATGAKKATVRIERQIVRQTGKETVRRETEIKHVYVKDKQAAARLDALATKNAALLQEIQHASHANDDAACLGRDAVGRLSAIH